MTTERPPWFKCYPEKLLCALAALPHDAAHLYLIMLLRIYEVGGPIPDHHVALSHRTKMSPKRVANALDDLILAGKIIETQYGYDSPTTHEHLQNRKEVLENKKIGAEIRWAKIKQKQSPPSTDAYQMESYLDLDKDNKKIPKKKIPKGLVEILMVGAGLTEKTAKDVVEHRKVIGKPMSVRAAEMLAKELFDWGDGEEAAACLIRQSWRGFKPEWAQNLGMKRPANGSSHPNGTSGIFVKRDTPQWDAWQVWWMKTKGKSMPGGDGWYCPSEWPPS